MSKILFIGLLFIASCASQRTEYICVADVFKDSKCMVVPCERLNDICKTGKYRVIKNYMTGYIYIYSLEPFTDLAKCKQSARVTEQ